MTVLLGEFGMTSNQIICHIWETEIKTLLKEKLLFIQNVINVQNFEFS